MSATATPTETVGPSATPTDTVAATATATDTAAPATATSTPSETSTATPISATATTTPTNPIAVTIIVGDASGSPGETVAFDVTLQTAVQVGGTTNDIIVEPPLSIATGENGTPRCSVNPSINRDATTFTLDCTSEDVCTLHAVVLPIEGSDPIPNGARLYTCDVAIDLSASIVQQYPLLCANPQSSDASGNPLATGCIDGTVDVHQPPLSTPTPLPPSPTPTSTVAPNPSDTPTVPLPPPTATGTAPFITTHSGCQIVGSTDGGLAWLLLVPLLLAATRRQQTEHPGRR